MAHEQSIPFPLLIPLPIPQIEATTQLLESTKPARG